MDRLAQRNKQRKLEKWLEDRKIIGDKVRKMRIEQKADADAKKAPVKKEQFIPLVGIPDIFVLNLREAANDNESAFSSYRGFYQKLVKRGFEYIGSGAYSKVLGKKDSDRVIKVCRHAESDGWVDYVLWANQAGYGGTFAPKIYSYKWIKATKEGEDFGVAVMERMKQTVGHAKRTEDAKFLPMLFEYGVYANDNAKLLADLVAPGIGNFIDDFRKEFGESGNFDLHSGNFMVREDGSFCVSDPLAGHGSKAFLARYRRAA